MRIKLPPIKFGMGRGFLKKMRLTPLDRPTAPHFRGALMLPEARPKGSILKLTAWMYTNELGTVLYLGVVTRKMKIEYGRKRRAEAQAEKADYAKFIEAKAKHEAGPPPKIKPKPQPKEIRRKDII